MQEAGRGLKVDTQNKGVRNMVLRRKKHLKRGYSIHNTHKYKHARTHCMHMHILQCIYDLIMVSLQKEKSYAKRAITLFPVQKCKSTKNN